MPEQGFQPAIDPIDVDLEIDANLGDEILRSQERLRDLIEFRRELVHPVARDRHARCHAVPAETEQGLPRLAQRAVQIEFGYRAAGAFPLAAGQRDQNRRSSELFYEPRRDYSDYPGMPRLIGEDDPERVVEIHLQNS